MAENNFKVGIIAAMTLEAEEIISAMTDVTQKTVSGITFYSGKLNEKNCIVAVCGIGKVFAAICTQTMILEYAPNIIINTGVAGALTDKLSIGDIIIAENLVQHDMDTSAIGDPVGLISGINVIHLPCSDTYSKKLLEAASEYSELKCITGTVASGDKFMSNSDEKKRIAKTFSASACEMEGASVGQVCYVNDIPCCVMRAISDGGDEDAAIDYPTFAKMAAERGCKVIKRFFELI